MPSSKPGLHTRVYTIISSSTICEIKSGWMFVYLAQANMILSSANVNSKGAGFGRRLGD